MNLPQLKETYEGLSFFDSYGSSLILVILISIVLFLLISLSYAYLQAASLKADWEKNRCKPSVLPFAGMIMKPTDMTMSEYTSQNFNYCMQNNLKAVAGQSLDPLNFIMSSLTTMVSEAGQAMEGVRAMTSKVRSQMGAVFKEIYGRLVNFIIPLQNLIIKVKDSFGKIQGVLVTTVYTFLGTYFGLQSFMGVLAQVLVNIMIALAAIIMVLWITPFTWGTAAAGTALFTAISIPLIVFITFLRNTFQMDVKFGNLKIPKPKKLKCFDKDTQIVMHDGSLKRISEIQPGEKLRDNDKVTSIFQVVTKGSDMYDLNGTKVSDTHLVLDNFSQKWVRVHQHKEAKKIEDYKEPFLYCLGTESGTIRINNFTFSDWNEFLKPNTKETTNGLSSETFVKLKNGEKISIQNIQVNDVLADESIVYGIVKLDGNDVEQYEYKDIFLKASNNIIYYDKFSLVHTWNLENLNREKVKRKESTLFHILTDSGIFTTSDGIQMGDYNLAIDCL